MTNDQIKDTDKKITPDDLISEAMEDGGRDLEEDLAEDLTLEDGEVIDSEAYVPSFTVALVGRPNVGKSSLFNVLTKKRSALVKNQPGVTRDLRFGTAEWWGETFRVVDTGGWTDNEDSISNAIRKKLSEVLTRFDHLVFLCDIKEGLTSDDKNLFSLVRSMGLSYTLVLNKDDSQNEDDYEFYQLGEEEYLKISCEHKIGVDVLVEKIIEEKKAHAEEIGGAKNNEYDLDKVDAYSDEGLKITVVGRPNVGKSSLVNRILNKERQLVSDMAGTTTDSLMFKARRDGLNFSIYDTAGVRRHVKMDGELEGLTVLKSFETIEKANFVLLVLDGTETPSRAEARLISRCNDLAKPYLIVVNKWDLIEKGGAVNKDTFKKNLKNEFHFLKSLEVVFISAKTGSGVDRLFEDLTELREKLTKRIGTGELNRFFERVIKQAPAPFYNNKPVKLYYITQTKQRTPSFLCFANHPKGVTPSYRRFIVNRIRDEFDFSGVPVRVFFLPKDSSKRGLKFNG